MRIDDVPSVVTSGPGIIDSDRLRRRRVLQAAVLWLNRDARHKRNRGDTNGFSKHALSVSVKVLRAQAMGNGK